VKKEIKMDIKMTRDEYTKLPDSAFLLTTLGERKRIGKPTQKYGAVLEVTEVLEATEVCVGSKDDQSQPKIVIQLRSCEFTDVS
jgi:hypothetical protein